MVLKRKSNGKVENNQWKVSTAKTSNNNAIVIEMHNENQRIQQGSGYILGDEYQVLVDVPVPDYDSDIEQDDLEVESADENEVDQTASSKKRVGSRNVTNDTNDVDMSLSASGITAEQLAKDPELCRLVNQLVEEKLQAKKTEQSGEMVSKEKTPVRPRLPVSNGNLVKSLSDTTLYAPAFVDAMAIEKGNDNQLHRLSMNRASDKNNKNRLIDDITQFIESVRLEQSATGEEDVPGQANQTHAAVVINQTMGGGGEVTGTPIQVTPELLEARACTDKTVMDAEKFQAQIAPPPVSLIQTCIMNYTRLE